MCYRDSQVWHAVQFGFVTRFKTREEGAKKTALRTSARMHGAWDAGDSLNGPIATGAACPRTNLGCPGLALIVTTPFPTPEGIPTAKPTGTGLTKHYGAIPAFSVLRVSVSARIHWHKAKKTPPKPKIHQPHPAKKTPNRQQDILSGTKTYWPYNQQYLWLTQMAALIHSVVNRGRFAPYL